MRIFRKIVHAFSLPKIIGTLGVFRPNFIRSLCRGETPDMLRWNRKGRPAPAPQSIKNIILKEYAHTYKCSNFVETGTHLGDTPKLLQADFQDLYTIELSEHYYNIAKDNLAPYGNIRVFHGASTDVLNRILPNLNQATMFWLDGHYSGGKTAMGDKACPLREELELIFAHPLRSHIILIDDARYFGVLDDYPSISELIEWGSAAGYSWELNFDIFAFIPEAQIKLESKINSLIA
jgi:hypothetical protein